MIINVRGTNGSGKSYLVRQVMLHYASMHAVYAAGRTRQSGYVCSNGDGKDLFVVGQYSTACGGADSIETPDEVYELVRREAAAGRHVIYEGIIVQDDVRRCVELHQDFAGHVQVIGLRVPVEECLQSIARRRATRGNTAALNPENTINRAHSLERTMLRLADHGVSAEWCSREDALERCLKAFALTRDDANLDFRLA
jgi:predicted kinase